MPIHDWTRVSAGTFHAFHGGWITRLENALNDGVLPEDYYALGEQSVGRAGPDVLALQDSSSASGEGAGGATNGYGGGSDTGGIALAAVSPRVSVIEEVPAVNLLSTGRRTIVIRHANGDRVVALLEIVSPNNKTGRFKMAKLVDKAVAAVQQGYHLLMVDLLPPGKFNPRGLHDRIWHELDGGQFDPPANRPLTLAAYRVSDGVTAYVEPVAVGQALPEMPLFFTPDRYVNVPLAETYEATYRHFPERWRRVIEGIRELGD